MRFSQEIARNRLARAASRRGLELDTETLERAARAIVEAPRDPLVTWQCARVRHGYPCDGSCDCCCDIPF